MKNKPSQLGFTLIELAITLTLITVLTLLVFPAYSNYVKKSQISESIGLVSTTKMAVYHSATSNSPLTSLWTPPIRTEAIKDISIYLNDTTGISLSSHGEAIANLPARHAGEIVITFSIKIAPPQHNELVLSPRLADPSEPSSNGHELPLDFSQPVSSTQTIIWECNSAHPPHLNRGTRGSIDVRLVPADCRA